MKTFKQTMEKPIWQEYSLLVKFRKELRPPTDSHVSEPFGSSPPTPVMPTDACSSC